MKRYVFYAYAAERSAEVRFIAKLMPCEQNENEKMGGGFLDL